MIPIIGWVRVARAVIASGREAAEWTDSPAFADELSRAYPVSAGFSLDSTKQTK